MTGYGNAVLETGGLIVRAEIKSLNSKNLDLQVRMPRAYSEKEVTLRSELMHIFQRGKVSINIEVEYTNPDLNRRTLNRTLLAAYYKELKDAADELGTETGNLLPTLLQMPDVLKMPETASSPDEWTLIETVMQNALKEFEEFRVKEGKITADEITLFVSNIAASLKEIDAIKDNRVAAVRENIRTKLDDLLKDGRLDENRFENEMIYYIEKLDISEEILRLGSHIALFNETMKEDAPGKKLGFIGQEMGREINTIGSKANDANLQKFAVMMKEELEKIKEQVANIL